MEWTGARGRRVVVTGATGGIGLAAAEALAAKGTLLTIVGRSESRAAAAAGRVRAAGGSGTEVDVLLADLSSLAEVRRLAGDIVARYPRVDVLVANAGAMFTTRQLTVDGLEATWALNHLAPFLLTTLLLDRLRESAPARIVLTTSALHQRAVIPFDDLDAQRSYRGFTRYGESKLANILFVSELSRRLDGSGVAVNCFHPGWVATGIGRNNGLLYRLGSSLVSPFARRPEKGADTLVWLVDTPAIPGETGGYFVDRRRVSPAAVAEDTGVARRLWEVSEEQTRQRASAVGR